MPTFVESFSDYVSQEVIGNTWEGREQKLLKICRGGCGDKPAMYLHGGTHAREWVSPATVAYFVNELTVNLTPENEDLIEQLDWYILIVHNPDGYDYSWTTDRGGRNATRLLVGLIGLGNSLAF